MTRATSSKLLVRLLWTFFLATLAGFADAGGGSGPKIVNGLATTGYPAVAALLDREGDETCTATLIGCRTLLTAAHCVCRGRGSSCQEEGNDLVPPESIRVFLQHAGTFDVSSIHVPETYRFGERDDVAILRLFSEVTSVPPAPINDVFDPPPGSPGVIVGFGLTEGSARDNGVKRMGEVLTETCAAVPEATHVCWRFATPVGAQGRDSNTCFGDSGGPLLIDVGGIRRVAGITSGGVNLSCLAEDESWDTNVFAVRDWIRTVAGFDLGKTCGPLPRLGDSRVTVATASGIVTSSDPEDVWAFEVAPDTLELRIGLNGEEGIENDFNLLVAKEQDPGTPFVADCVSGDPGSFGSCVIASPAAGAWLVRVEGEGTGAYQLVVTSFAEPVFFDGFESGDAFAWTLIVSP